VGAALTVTLRRGGLLLSVLVLPLTVPTLIFGVAMVQGGGGGARLHHAAGAAERHHADSRRRLADRGGGRAPDDAAVRRALFASHQSQ
jgi:hypothetical protein